MRKVILAATLLGFSAGAALAQSPIPPSQTMNNDASQSMSSGKTTAPMNSQAKMKKKKKSMPKSDDSMSGGMSKDGMSKGMSK